jgi:YfiH family protein
VRSLITTRRGGVSTREFESLNLGVHIGDDPAAVAENRARVRVHLPAEPLWLRQVHGTRVVDAAAAGAGETADAVVARGHGLVCTVTIADCLPVLVCDRAGSCVGIAHAGWRGLSAGILEHTIKALACSPSEILAFLGPAIGPSAFEVGADVLTAFAHADPSAVDCFRPKSAAASGERKWLADLYALARSRLKRVGVSAVFGGSWCTYGDSQRFFSHRRDGRTGRQAAFIWIDHVRGQCG